MNIKCGVIEDLLPLYAENLCSEDSRVIVEHHLAVCPECKARLKAVEDGKKENGGYGGINGFKRKKQYYAGIIVSSVCALAAVIAAAVILLTAP